MACLIHSFKASKLIILYKKNNGESCIKQVILTDQVKIQI